MILNAEDIILYLYNQTEKFLLGVMVNMVNWVMALLKIVHFPKELKFHKIWLLYKYLVVDIIVIIFLKMENYILVVKELKDKQVNLKPITIQYQL